MSPINRSDLRGRAPGGRKLIAIVHIDMVGYSRLIGIDDAGTLSRLRALRHALIDPAVNEHGGTIVQTGGDSLLIVFDSIDGAMRCGVEVQRQVPVYDGDQPPDRRIRFRAGISIGDVIADGTDLHGDGVNIAARLQAECPPGGVCVSRAIRDHVHDRLDLNFEELGALAMKNIAKPVEAFVLRFDPEPAGVSRPQGRVTTGSIPLPDKPSIAVLPFRNMSADPEQEYFADGIADDIITELSRCHALFVIARNSSFTYKGRAVDVNQIARELGVRYVLEGSVRRYGERIRITAQLISAETNTNVWAERYDRGDVDVFAVQDDITRAVVTAIQPVVADAELQRALRRPPENLDAWEMYQRGLGCLSKLSLAHNEKARAFFQRAFDLDPGFASSSMGLALCFLREGYIYLTHPPQEVSRLAETWARRATEADPNDAEAAATLAFAKHIMGNQEAAWRDVQQSLAINPNSAFAYQVKGMCLLSTGRATEARDAILMSLRLNPRDPLGVIALSGLAVSYYYDHDYASAAQAARQAAANHPDHSNIHRWLAASLGQLGRTIEAKEALRCAIAVSPRSFDFYVRDRPPWHRPEDHEHMLDGLRKAGWQDDQLEG